jgi:hypothetical protein
VATRAVFDSTRVICPLLYRVALQVIRRHVGGSFSGLFPAATVAPRERSARIFFPL